MTMVIAVANNKGGVAKTTTCLSLGGALAEQGWLVLLVDLDPQAHLTASLGVDPGTLRRTVADVLLAQNSLVAISQETTVPGLDLAPANRELVILDKVLYKRPGYEYRLKTDLDRTRYELYDFVILDCPPTFGTVTLNALTAADLLLIPTQCEYYAARSLRQMTEMVKLVRQKSNPHLAYRLLVTMLDKRNKIHRLILSHMRFRFPRILLRQVIQVDTRLRESPAFGQPVTHYAPKTRASLQYRALAEELVADLRPLLPTGRRIQDPVPAQESAAPPSTVSIGAMGL